MIKLLLFFLSTGPLLFAADPAVRPPEPPIPARIITVHEGDTNRIYCGALMDCSIQAPKGEKFDWRTIGDDAHFHDSVESLPSAYYSIKASYVGFSTSVHLRTDHGNE